MHQRKKLLYIGNKLAEHGKPPTAIDSLSVKFENEGYSVIMASSKKNRLGRMFDMIWTTLKNKNEISLVLIDTYSTQNFYYALIIGKICRLLDLPYVPVLHGGNLPKRLSKNKGFSNIFFGKAYTNVAPSEYILEQFKTMGFQNLTYIPNTLEIKNYPFQPRKIITPKLLWVRSFAEIYNPLLALEIVEGLLKRGIKVSLCMVGPDKDGSMARCKKIAADLKLPVVFPGLLKKEEWISLSKEYTIFINTTNFDNMPVSVMEAMALGLPVVSTNVGGMPFLIKDNIDGILVPPNNSELFVNVIEELCANPPKVEEITKNARIKVEQLDWQIVKHSWMELIGKA
ncbi:glycosyltransferase family 4 protein [Aequorivita marisscotiae]|uniref:Glycosyltransferase family 4 protein n=1 Tax=Aequorivita marisscotiae TaxID=3040348 RepID=A0ABY8KYD2_9FLAO|nr:glycosyltransferase family 4 protein [Aequorivita sp. Ant34-E75]WGF92727.1 glycosyltransferase family 4 protein [Aequorivita sp. Ant34-E75]